MLSDRALATLLARAPISTAPSNCLVFPSYNIVKRGILLHQRLVTQPQILPKPRLFTIVNLKFSSLKELLFNLHLDISS